MLHPHPNSPTTLGLAYSRYGNRPCGIRQADRMQHLYIVGQTGVGKTTLIKRMAVEDSVAGRGFCVIDPHGDLAHALSVRCPSAVFWEVADPACPYGYNPLTKTSPSLRPLVTSGLIEALRKQWSDAWGVRMEHLLRHALLALLDCQNADLRDIPRLFLDRQFRLEVLTQVIDPQVRQFWSAEYPAMNYKNASDGFAPIANKLGAFLANPVVRKSLCEPSKPLRFRAMMDAGQGLIVSLPKGRLGGDVTNVLGGLLVASITHAAFTRSNISECARRPFFLYVDEFHNFTSEVVAELLSETRKYKLGLILAQQHTQQTSPAVAAAVFGNAGSMVAFRLGASDAPSIAAQLGYTDPIGLTTQANYRATARLMIENEPSKPFSLMTVNSSMSV